MDLDIAVWTNKHSEWLERCVASIVRYSKFSYNLIIVCEEGNCHENMQKVLDRGNSRFLLFVDEDVEYIDSLTIPGLRRILIEDDACAIAAPFQFRTEPEVTGYRNGRYNAGNQFLVKTSVGAYSMMVDRKKVPDLYAECGYKCPKYFTDTDMCYQAVGKGYHCILTDHHWVYHAMRETTGKDTEFTAEANEQFRAKWDVHEITDAGFPRNLSPEPILRISFKN